MVKSEYAKGLDEPARSRYRLKIEQHIGCDPYNMKKNEFSRNLNDLPKCNQWLVFFTLRCDD